MRDLSSDDGIHRAWQKAGDGALTVHRNLAPNADDRNCRSVGRTAVGAKLGRKLIGEKDPLLVPAAESTRLQVRAS